MIVQQEHVIIIIKNLYEGNFYGCKVTFNIWWRVATNMGKTYNLQGKGIIIVY